MCIVVTHSVDLVNHLVKISAPVFVIKMVCSNCAAGLPSSVTAVQLSPHVMQSMLPIVRIGSAFYKRKGYQSVRKTDRFRGLSNLLYS